MPKGEMLVITEKMKPVEMKVKKEAVETKVKEEGTIIIKKRKIDTSANKNGRKEWLRVSGIKLRMEDRDSVIAGKRLKLHKDCQKAPLS